VFGELEATALEGGPDRRHVRVAEQEEDVDAVHVLLKEIVSYLPKITNMNLLYRSIYSKTYRLKMINY